MGTCKPSEMASVYGVPLVEALKLLRVIASRSRSMASDLVHKFRVMESVVSYISIDPRYKVQLSSFLCIFVYEV